MSLYHSIFSSGLEVRAYSKKDEFLGRLEISHAGIAVYTGAKGTKLLGNLSWEKFFDRMTPEK